MRLRLWLSALATFIFYTIFAAHAASITVSSSVENVSYDLGFMKLSLEKIASNMRISPTIEGKLLIEDVNAQRLVITMVKDLPPSKPSAGLPDKINLPLAIRVKAARIAEVLIINGEDSQTLNDVAFNLEADENHLNLELVNASTPWGEVSSNLSIENAKPFALDGHLKIAKANASSPYAADLKLSGNLQQLQFSTAGILSKQGNQHALLLDDADIDPEHHIARVLVSGNLGLENDMPLNLQAQLLSANHNLPNQPHNTLNLGMQIKGTLSPQPNLSADLHAQDSYWGGEPLKLDARANLIGKVIQQISLNAALKNNTLSANGSLGNAAEPLIWQARFDDISAFDNTLAGKLDAQGKLSQFDDQFQLTMDWLGEHLQIADTMQISKLIGNADINTGEEAARLNVDLHLENASLKKGERFNSLLTLRGSPSQHQIELKSTATNEKLNNHQLLVRIAGSLGADDKWQATLNVLDYQGDKSIKLAQSASLQYDAQAGFQLKNLALQLAQGHLYIDQLQTGNGQFSSQGRIASIGLGALPSLLLELPSNVQGNPVFSGAWDIHAADQANGHASLTLESGDISITAGDGSTKSLGLRSFVANLLIEGNNIRVSSEASGNQLGELSAKLNTKLSQTSTGLAINNDAPLDISANAVLNTLLWVPMPESMAGATLDGQLTLSLEGNGTVAKPNLNGSVTGKRLSLTIPSEGVNLSNGLLDATFSNDQLVIKQAKFQGGDGFLTATGAMQLARGEPELSLTWQAENFTVASRTDRLIVIAGEIDTKLSSNLLEVSGQVEIIRGLILLANEDKPTLSDDVVIIGREIEVAEDPLMMKVTDLKIGIGNRGQFVLRGRGLDSTLVGRITLNGLPNQSLRAEGSISAAGTYLAYGQVLKIERGQLNFSGPVDNPGLNILALRQNMAVRAGVEIRGNVLNPTVKLVSIPEVSDSDKLSWLVLGHGIDQAGQDQFAMLSLAAGALLSQGQSVPLQTRFARAAGLDSFNVGGSSAENTSVSLGKRLASNLYLTYEKEVTGLLNVARLTYDITNRWSIRTQAGSESAVDVLYTFSFK